ncbi:hypothetical protein AvCA_02620 [Azotobacter vinelandii CA]|uniref:Uncharacterized protein n=2 Tax=Azotobacter vinelandii TaxID=354 RepID=C1DI26_AZOVD|nr:hypothetical protein Avin_02620 [Azotobacter vinelandii DJ]AGK15655.1 hypothetical protein AvCA_02620 [Azotobacter vinelandii CA]AGK19188.1 hypothetical protein AvCA6_02620 [Azotobacter vinelandii CA6]
MSLQRLQEFFAASPLSQINPFESIICAHFRGFGKAPGQAFSGLFFPVRDNRVDGRRVT